MCVVRFDSFVVGEFVGRRVVCVCVCVCARASVCLREKERECFFGFFIIIYSDILL